jgi:2-dehydro-3-deoxygalactonokinase
VEEDFFSSDGVAHIHTPGDFAGVLKCAMEKIGAQHPVVISGMAGSSIGWCELPYAGLPFRLDGSDAVLKEIEEGIWVVSGVCGETEIMRGKETELLGLDAGAGDLLVVLPGTHSKHCLLRNGCLAHFRTFMTGELRQVIRSQTILARSISEGWEADAFCDGVQAGATSSLLENLFQVRTRELLAGCSWESNGSYLDGLLIGAELSQLPAELPILLAAGPAQHSAYSKALVALGFDVRSTILTPAETSLLAVIGHQRLLEKQIFHRITPIPG